MSPSKRLGGLVGWTRDPTPLGIRGVAIPSRTKRTTVTPSTVAAGAPRRATTPDRGTSSTLLGRPKRPPPREWSDVQSPALAGVAAASNGEGNGSAHPTATKVAEPSAPGRRDTTGSTNGRAAAPPPPAGRPAEAHAHAARGSSAPSPPAVAPAVRPASSPAPARSKDLADAAHGGLLASPAPSGGGAPGDGGRGSLHEHLVAPVPKVLGRRPRVRRVTRVVRHVDPWSVFKVAIVFNLVLYGVCLTAGVLLWNVAESTGTIDNLERFFESFGWDTFEFHGDEVFHNAWIAGLFGVIGLTGAAVLAATLFNLITDLVGGVRMTVLEEEVVERTAAPARRFVVRRPGAPGDVTRPTSSTNLPARHDG